MPLSLTRLLRILILLFLPLLLIIGPIRLLVTDGYLRYEYGKANFPPDPFGFSTAQRVEFASANFRYVRENLPLEALAGTFPDGSPLYNSRELSHMQDVQRVYQTVWWLWRITLGLTLLAGVMMAWRRETRPALAAALKTGGLLTAGLVGAVGLLAVVAWQVWFVAFHQIFFAAGTWTFNYSDTLIRLFPEKFWFDAALAISGQSLVGGLLFTLIGWLWQNRFNPRPRLTSRI